MYFERSGEENTEATLKIAIESGYSLSITPIKIEEIKGIGGKNVF